MNEWMTYTLAIKVGRCNTDNLVYYLLKAYMYAVIDLLLLVCLQGWGVPYHTSTANFIPCLLPTSLQLHWPPVPCLCQALFHHRVFALAVLAAWNTPRSSPHGFLLHSCVTLRGSFSIWTGPHTHLSSLAFHPAWFSSIKLYTAWHYIIIFSLFLGCLLPLNDCNYKEKAGLTEGGWPWSCDHRLLLCHILAMCPWASSLASLSLSFLIGEMHTVLIS